MTMFQELAELVDFLAVWEGIREFAWDVFGETEIPLEVLNEEINFAMWILEGQ